MPVPLAPEYLEEIHIEDALKSIGFKEDAFGSLEWKWQGLNISAGMCFGGWKLNAQRFTSRTMLDLEKLLPDVAIKGWYYAEIYKIWREEFPVDQVSLFSDDLNIPAGLVHGKEYLEHLEILRMLVPPNPWIEIERLYARDFANKLKKRMDIEDPKVDCPVEMHFHNGQIVFDVFGEDICMPAKANWFGSVTFSMRDFLKACKRFDRDTVRFEYNDSYLRIGNKSIKADWHE